MENVDLRDTKAAIKRGALLKCPRCGEGHVFDGYLKVRDSCDVCSLDFTPQRADDGPAYLTILIVGHLLVPALHIAYRFEDPNPWVVAGVLSALTAALSLALLPRIKAALIGFQWSKHMHGF